MNKAEKLSLGNLIFLNFPVYQTCCPGALWSDDTTGMRKKRNQVTCFIFGAPCTKTSAPAVGEFAHVCALLSARSI